MIGNNAQYTVGHLNVYNELFVNVRGVLRQHGQSMIKSVMQIREHESSLCVVSAQFTQKPPRDH